MIEQLDGFELAAAAWEHDVLPARVEEYDPVAARHAVPDRPRRLGRMTPEWRSGPIRSSPIALCCASTPLGREAVGATGSGAVELRRPGARGPGAAGRLVLPRARAAHGPARTHVERALGELAGAGLVTADSFGGLRALLTPSSKRKPLGGRSRHRTVAYGVETAGRWSLRRHLGAERQRDGRARARVLLKRYGVVFRSLLAREPARRRGASW